MYILNPLLKNKVFLIVASADLLQQVGIWIRNMALLFYIMDQTNNDPTAVSMLTALEYLPIFIFSLIGGTFADRWNPKKTVILGDTLSALSILVIFFLISSGLWQAVFAATVVSAIVSQFSQPSSAILFKKHVPLEQVGMAVGITQSLMAVFTILGPIVGTFVYTQLGLQSSLITLFFIFLTAALLQLFLPSSSDEKPATNQSALVDLKAGLHYVIHHSNLRLIAGMFLLAGLSIGITQPLDVFVTIERLGLPKESVQWFAASEGIGMLVGGLLAAAGSKWVDRNQNRIITATLILWSIVTLIEVLSIWPLLTAGVRVISGVATAFFQVIFSAVMIKEVQEDYIGRTNGVMVPLMIGGVLTGTICSGFVAEHLSLFGAYGLSALLTLSCTILTAQLRFQSTSKNKRGDSIQKETLL